MNTVMNAAAVFWAVAIVINSLVTVAKIGQPRKPVTHGDAIAVLIANSLIAATLVWFVVQ